jgi:phosphotransferase family enzyme
MLRWVLDDSGEFPDLPGLDQLAPEQVVELGGGVDAATYLVRCPDRDVVVKLKSNGIEAEARALRAWRPYTTRVPEVLGSGTVPSAGERPTKYLILAALKNDAGQLVETAAEYLDRSPASARELGRALGAELHRMHHASGAGRDRLRQLRGFSGQRAYLSQLERLPRGLLRAAC